jgi:hypothetical protein
VLTRDLLALDLDVVELLPAGDTSHGFDTIEVDPALETAVEPA